MSGREKLRQVGRLIKVAESSGPVRFVTGVTTAAPASGWITVDVGAQVIKASIPGSFRSTLAEGQNVRLSVQGTLYTLDSILSALPTSSVDAPADPTAGQAYGADPGANLAALQSSTVHLAAKINEVRADIDEIHTVLAGLREALAAEGIVS